ncbi:MAG: uracil-DNA glycosylase family protein [Planctomycetota bacterium]
MKRAHPRSSPLVATLSELAQSVSRLRFSEPVTHVYNPLDYAWECHREYLERYGRGTKAVLLVGMNPGPFGMVQTGIPFGEVAAARDWLRLEVRVQGPRVQHPKRPIEGFACRRSEVSGRRLWGWAAARFKTPEKFFQRFFVHNYCPLAFLESTGRNRTPDKLPATERDPLFAACDTALRGVIDTIAPEIVVGVGAFAEARIRAAAASRELRIGRVLHPSPASPAANRGWEAQVDQALRELGVPVG